MAILKRHKSSIAGLVDDLTSIRQSVQTEQEARIASDGDLAALVTTNKENLVVAINELAGNVTDSASTALQKASNLSDLTDLDAARAVLDVLTAGEVSEQIDAARLALGSNFTVADLTERDALTGLDENDRVFVRDDGDTRWAMYKPAVVGEDGVVTEWVKLSDQDALENSISAAGIKASYESNEDTNSFTDEAQAKVANLSVTAPVDLDDAVFKASLEQDLAAAAPEANAPSAAAVKAYADRAAIEGGAVPTLESVVVTDGTITLASAPKAGVAGVMNFATVRFISEDGVAYDAPVVATADPRVFTVSTDSANQWDGNTVQVQYLRVAG